MLNCALCAGSRKPVLALYKEKVWTREVHTVECIVPLCECLMSMKMCDLGKMNEDVNKSFCGEHTF